MVDYEQIHPASRAEWRAWLAENHDRRPGVWVVSWKATTGRPRPSYDDLVEEALCFGWIDSRARGLDDERSAITMTPRRATGPWSRSNKDRVERLVADGLMTDAGLRVIETAKGNGAWNALDDVEALVVPADLGAALAAVPAAQRHFEGFSPSAKKMILAWVAGAKRDETRARRIAETVRLATVGRRPGSPDT